MGYSIAFVFFHVSTPTTSNLLPSPLHPQECVRILDKQPLPHSLPPPSPFVSSTLKDNHRGAYLPCQNILLELLEKTKLRKVLFGVFYCYVSSLPKPNHSKASFLKFYLPNYLFFFFFFFVIPKTT